MSRYAIIDVANLFYRARHVVRGDAYTKAGMALTIVFRSLRKMHREYKADHFVFCVEGRSWRYDAYPKYKAKRKLDRLNATPVEKEEEEAFMAVMNEFQTYLSEKTRCTVLQADGVEGDDWVARWIQLHPSDEHVVLSGDSDFLQLLAPNVKIFNGVDDRLMTTKGVFDATTGEELVFTLVGGNGKISVKGTVKELRDKHNAEQKELEKAHNASQKILAAEWNSPAHVKLRAANGDTRTRFVPTPFERVDYEEFIPEAMWWRKALFIKLIRGDSGDGVFSAFPGVRYNGSAKKVGICEAWEDVNTKGYNWNNFMLQSWEKLEGVDEDGNPIKREVRVIDEYKINESLIDLTMQPDHIKQLMDDVIVEAVQKQPIGNVGIHFMRYCEKNYLPNLTKEATDHAAYLNAPYSI